MERGDLAGFEAGSLAGAGVGVFMTMGFGCLAFLFWRSSLVASFII